ncbi:unnamed protein product [Adineta ricciae]|uniref:Uncharacterized protein n=1 Tax=Adineta ricciae TaxID=249248 RepID=A0A815CYS6_ADIRI|nr:unnamed protein product [Adineta ricciae]
MKIELVFLCLELILKNWRQNGSTICGENGRGDKLNQLSDPVGIFIDKHQNIFIADSGNDRIVQWKRNENRGTIVAGGNRRGNRLNQPTDVIVDEQNNSIIIADFGNRRFNSPSFLFVDDEQSLYVSDWDNHCVMKWRKDAQEGIVVAGRNGCGENLNQLNYPQGIIVDHEGRIYVVDYGNHRIQRFDLII